MYAVTASSTLGFWQLRRAAEKEALLEAFAGNEAGAPIDLAVARRMPTGPIHPHVRVRGRFDPLRGYVLDDQVRDGRRGLMAYALFEPLDGSSALLVNRGFMPRGTGEPPALPPLDAGEQELTGVYAPPPGSGLRLGGNPLPGQAKWPKSTIYIDLDEIAADLGRGVGDRVLLLDADPASGFMRDWTPQILPPERHRGYALQWFSFGIAACVIFIVLHWRREKPGSP